MRGGPTTESDDLESISIASATVEPVQIHIPPELRVGSSPQATCGFSNGEELLHVRLRGRACGFERSAEMIGAVVGPLIAAGLVFATQTLGE